MQVLLPLYGTGFGVQLTVPPAVGLAVAVIANCAKLAVTLLGDVTPDSVHDVDVPVQAPVKLTNPQPELGVAVQVVLPLYGTGFGVQPTVPPAVGLAVAEIAFCAKLAVTLLVVVTPDSVHDVDVPVQSPVKLTKP